MPKKRRNIAVSLSFLDIMACGFGAVTLLFLILRHNATEVITPDIRISAEVDMLQMDIRQAEAGKSPAAKQPGRNQTRIGRSPGALRAGDYRFRRTGKKHSGRPQRPG